LNDAENLAKVDFLTSLPLQSSVAPMRRSVVAHAYIVTLTIAGRRVVYLENAFQEISETGLVGIDIISIASACVP
jgi:hypothetical protein